MKKRLGFIFIFGFCLIFIISCKSTDKLIENKQYDDVITIEVDKISSGKVDEKSVKLLAQAFHSANQMDHEHILQLKASGQPDIWLEIYNKYCLMNKRQNIVNQLPDAVKNQIGFVKFDFDHLMVESNLNAQRYLVAKAHELQKSGNKTDAAIAYELLVKLKTLNPNFPNIDAMLRQAMLTGMTNVLLTFEDKSGLNLPENVVSQLMNFIQTDFGNSKIHYALMDEQDVQFENTFLIQVNHVTVSPERSEKSTFTEQTNLNAVETHQRTNSGSLETPGLIVNEIVMTKSCEISGKIDFINNTSHEVEFSIPIRATSNFKYEYATLSGDLNAASGRSLSLSKNKPILYPTKEMMILDGAKQFNILVKQLIINDINN